MITRLLGLTVGALALRGTKSGVQTNNPAGRNFNELPACTPEVLNSPPVTVETGNHINKDGINVEYRPFCEDKEPINIEIDTKASAFNPNRLGSDNEPEGGEEVVFNFDASFEEIDKAGGFAKYALKKLEEKQALEKLKKTNPHTEQ